MGFLGGVDVALREMCVWMWQRTREKNSVCVYVCHCVGTSLTAQVGQMEAYTNYRSPEPLNCLKIFTGIKKRERMREQWHLRTVSRWWHCRPFEYSDLESPAWFQSPFNIKRALRYKACFFQSQGSSVAQLHGWKKLSSVSTNTSQPPCWDPHWKYLPIFTPWSFCV